MLADYNDIKSRIKDPILWYDSNGVPRYEKFHPDLCPNIYADEVVLLEISCQYCHKRFLVEMNWHIMDQLFNKHTEKITNSFNKWIKEGKKFGTPIHYGDPPIHECSGGGNTMNCYDLRVVEFWVGSRGNGWKRLTEYEIELEEDNE